jgi:hypothetical protein
MKERAERFFKYMKVKGLNDNQVTVSCELSQGLLGQARKGKSDLGPATINKILKIYQDLNRTWLLTGEGSMLYDSDVTLIQPTTIEEYTTTKSGNKYFKRSDGQLLLEVPLVPIAALGSPDDEWADIINDGTLEKVQFEVDAVHHGHYFSFKVEGSSMDDGTRNAFQPGDTVLVRELPRDEWAPRLRISDWPFWVVCWDNCVRIKQIIAQDTEAGTITLHSLNPSPEYTDFTLPLSRISHLFNVIQHQIKPIIYKK